MESYRVIGTKAFHKIIIIILTTHIIGSNLFFFHMHVPPKPIILIKLCNMNIGYWKLLLLYIISKGKKGWVVLYQSGGEEEASSYRSMWW